MERWQNLQNYFQFCLTFTKRPTKGYFFIHCFEDVMKITSDIIKPLFIFSLLSQRRLDYVRIRKGFLSWMAKMPEFPDEIYAIPPEMNNTEIYF